MTKTIYEVWLYMDMLESSRGTVKTWSSAPSEDFCVGIYCSEAETKPQLWPLTFTEHFKTPHFLWFTLTLLQIWHWIMHVWTAADITEINADWFAAPNRSLCPIWTRMWWQDSRQDAQLKQSHAGGELGSQSTLPPTEWGGGLLVDKFCLSRGGSPDKHKLLCWRTSLIGRGLQISLHSHIPTD